MPILLIELFIELTAKYGFKIDIAVFKDKVEHLEGNLKQQCIGTTQSIHTVDANYTVLFVEDTVVSAVVHKPAKALENGAPAMHKHVQLLRCLLFHNFMQIVVMVPAVLPQFCKTLAKYQLVGLDEKKLIRLFTL